MPPRSGAGALLLTHRNRPPEPGAAVAFVFEMMSARVGSNRPLLCDLAYSMKTVSMDKKVKRRRAPVASEQDGIAVGQKERRHVSIFARKARAHSVQGTSRRGFGGSAAPCRELRLGLANDHGDRQPHRFLTAGNERHDAW